jgi:hypothetical protein
MKRVWGLLPLRGSKHGLLGRGPVVDGEDSARHDGGIEDEVNDGLGGFVG